MNAEQLTAGQSMPRPQAAPTQQRGAKGAKCCIDSTPARCIYWLIGAGIILAAAGCDQQDPPPPALTNAVATVGDRIITVQAFQSELARRSGGMAGQRTSEDQRQAVLEEMILFEATLAQARAAGYDRRAEVLDQFDRMVVNRFREDHLSARSPTASPVGETEVRAYYERHATKYVTPEMARGAVLFRKCSPKATPEKKAELANQAARLLEQARQADAAEFSRLVSQHSEDQATRYAGGDTGWVRREGTETGWEPGVRDALFGLEAAGQLSQVVTTAQGFYLVRLVEKRRAQVRPFAEVREGIQYRLGREREQQLERDFSDEMKRGLKIQINRSLLESLPAGLPSREPRPPAGPSG